MRINKVATSAKALLIGLAGGGIGILISNAELTCKQNLNNCKMEILKKDPQRFLRVSESELKENKVNWTNELKLMNDSLKKDSLAHKAYFEGGRMIQANLDYIKNRG